MLSMTVEGSVCDRGCILHVHSKIYLRFIYFIVISTIIIFVFGTMMGYAVLMCINIILY